MQVEAFDGLTGRWLAHVPVSSCTWTQTISGEGGMDATVPAGVRLPGHAVQPWHAVWAVADGTRVLHAGWLTRVKRTVDGSLQATIGDGWTIWGKRLVLNHALDASWRDGQVLIDEDNPPGGWLLRLRGTYSDIARGLVAESLKWGSLPYDLPPVQGGSAHERSYQCWDMATVADRLSDLTDLEDGPEIRFDPRLTDDGRIRWLLRVGTPEIVDHEWTWHPLARGQKVTIGDMDRDGADMTGQCWAVGGKQDDVVLMCRRTGGTLTDQGWPPAPDGQHVAQQRQRPCDPAILRVRRRGLRRRHAGRHRPHRARLEHRQARRPRARHPRPHAARPQDHRRRRRHRHRPPRPAGKDHQKGKPMKWKSGTLDDAKVNASRRRLQNRRAKEANTANGSSLYQTTNKVRAFEGDLPAVDEKATQARETAERALEEAGSAVGMVSSLDGRVSAAEGVLVEHGEALDDLAGRVGDVEVDVDVIQNQTLQTIGVNLQTLFNRTDQLLERVQALEDRGSVGA